MKIFTRSLAIMALVCTHMQVKSQVIMWTDTFINGTAPTTAQQTTWNNFRAQLLSSYCYSKMTISGSYDPSGKVCTDTGIIKAFANALRTYTTYISTSTNGNVWSICNRYLGEVWINPPTSCSSSNCPNPGYIIRPGITNSNWGGINTATCGPPSQMQMLKFEYGQFKNTSASFCEGDSIELGGKYYNTPGQYTYIVTSPTGCDTNYTVDLTVDSIPTVALNHFVYDTICLQSAPIPLPFGLPTGGIYYGSGVVGNTMFDPAKSGTGKKLVIYEYTDSNGCSNTDTSSIVVISCLGIKGYDSPGEISIFPNPTAGVFILSVETNVNSDMQIDISNSIGQLVYSRHYPESGKINVEIDLSDRNKGVYFLTISNKSGRETRKLILSSEK